MPSILSLLVVAAASVPYVVAYSLPPSHVFAGVLINPLDGNSYLAKMREGWRGAWLFTLPYTATPGAGAFIFTYYLFLGHVARWTGASIEIIYHLARAAGGLCLLLTAYHFISRFIRPMGGTERPVEAPSASPLQRPWAFKERLAVWLLFSTGSGLGWLAVPVGAFTSDLWVAEAIPFLSIFSNAHFALAIALMLWIFLWTLPALTTSPPSSSQDGEGNLVAGSPSPARQGAGGMGRLALVALATTALAQIQPLALITVGLALGALTIWRIYGMRISNPGVEAFAVPATPADTSRGLRAGAAPARKFQSWVRYMRPALILPELLPVAVFGIFAAPWLIYDAVVSMTHPALAQWNAQNLTPSPPLWDALVSGGVPLLLALLGVSVAVRRRTGPDLLLLSWFGLGALSIYAPFSLQRRLSLGLWMPLVILAAYGFRDVVWHRLAGRRSRLLALGAVVVFSLPSNLLVYASTLAAIQTRQTAVFLTHDESSAIDWLRDAGSGRAPGALVVASPEMGLFIPARTDARVIYGHPFETVDAIAQRKAVEDFYAGRIEPTAFLHKYSPDLIFYGPREKAFGPPPALPGWREVFRQGEVAVYGR